MAVPSAGRANSERRTSIARQLVSATAPSFRGRSSTNAAATVVGRANRKKNSGPEMLLRREIWQRGIRYRLHDKRLPGSPDIVFSRARVAVFVDGDFWHGRHWAQRRKRLLLGANADYWVAKIESNRARDRANTRRLRQLGWTVIRLWETDVRRDPAGAAGAVLRLLE